MLLYSSTPPNEFYSICSEWLNFCFNSVSTWYSFKYKIKYQLHRPVSRIFGCRANWKLFYSGFINEIQSNSIYIRIKWNSSCLFFLISWNIYYLRIYTPYTFSVIVSKIHVVFLTIIISVVVKMTQNKLIDLALESY